MDSLPLDSSLSLSASGASPSPASPQTLDQQRLRQDIVETMTQPLSSADPVSSGVSRQMLENDVARINEALRPRGLEFEVSEESSRVIARVIDRETGDVIRQIPGEEVLAVAKRIEEMQSGLISLEA